MEPDEMLFRIGGDEFVLISLSANETELEQRLEQIRAGLVEASSGGKAPMIASFSFGCSRVDPLAGDTRRQMTMDADRKMYRYSLCIVCSNRKTMTPRNAQSSISFPATTAYSKRSP
ncbi:MAG: diguanylate cyclase domain-containing protein [Collinsella sp.]